MVGVRNNQSQQVSTRDGFGQGLLEAAQDNQAIVGLCADLTESVRMNWFAQMFPDRFIEVGVAEQNLVGLAAGLALAGKHPFAASYATFSPGNNWGPIRSSICYSNLSVTLVGGHTGIAIGPDGATHQGLEDIALMRVLPNMTVVVPADREEARKATKALSQLNSPSYLRISKYEGPAVTAPDTPFELGTSIELRSGTDVCLIACGTMVSTALETASMLAKKNISAQVVNMHTIKPIDTKRLRGVFSHKKLVVSLEDHQVAGGLGSAIAEEVSQFSQKARLLRIGINDAFGQSGSADDLLEAYGLTASQITQALIQSLNNNL